MSIEVLPGPGPAGMLRKREAAAIERGLRQQDWVSGPESITAGPEVFTDTCRRSAVMGLMRTIMIVVSKITHQAIVYIGHPHLPPGKTPRPRRPQTTQPGNSGEAKRRRRPRPINNPMGLEYAYARGTATQCPAQK